MLGQIIAARRQQLGLSQESLAEQVGLSRGAIAQLELGIIKWPRPDTLQRIADVLQTSVTLLLREAGIIPPAEESIEREIAELVTQAPEFADLLAVAREVNREDPEQLRDIVRYAKWLLEQSRGSGR